MTETEQQPKTKPRRWVRILLVVSLALNFIFIGAGAGFLLRGPGARDAIARDGAHMLARAMPRKDRHDLIREFRQRRGAISGDFHSFREQRARVIEILEQTPFDPDALLGVLGEQRARGSRIATIGHELVVSRLSAMSERERNDIARNLRRRPVRDTR